MSNPAQEEADRLFNNGSKSASSHPEDQERLSHDEDTDNDRPQHKTVRSSSRKEDHEVADPDLEGSDNDEDYDTAGNMAGTNKSKKTYTVPSTSHYANTGPKGVIADAQDYQRARQSTFRRTLNSISDTLSFTPKRTSPPQAAQEQKKSIRQGGQQRPSSDSDEDLAALSLDDPEDEFMQQWRQQRLAELQEQFSSSTDPQQKTSASRSPSGRQPHYGRLESVNANGYLDAVERTPKSTHVVVLLHDPESSTSVEVEDELKMIAYRWPTTRFVKLHHEVAEMETVDVPAILAYRGGDVFVTISGAEREGLEEVLSRQGVLKKGDR